MIRCMKSHINGEFFYTPIAATHIVEGHIYEISDEDENQIRTNAGWYSKEYFEDIEAPLKRLFNVGDRVKCKEDYKYFNYHKGFEIEKGKIYTVSFINGYKPDSLTDCSMNVDDFYSFHFLIGLAEDDSNVHEEAYYPEHYFELEAQREIVEDINEKDAFVLELRAMNDEDIKNIIKNISPTKKLFAAAKVGLIEEAIIALKEGADVNSCDDWGGDYPIELAIEYNHLDIVFYLLNKGADVTNMSLVFAFDNISLLSFLLDHIEKNEPEILTELNLSLAIEAAIDEERDDCLNLIYQSINKRDR